MTIRMGARRINPGNGQLTVRPTPLSCVYQTEVRHPFDCLPRTSENAADRRMLCTALIGDVVLESGVQFAVWI
jgi:hypothetical protein